MSNSVEEKVKSSSDLLLRAEMKFVIKVNTVKRPQIAVKHSMKSS
jgi:hypothetical protein